MSAPSILTRVMQILLCALSLGLCCGCGGNARIPVAGTVKVNGTLLQKGYIILLPEPGTSGPTAGADIVNGAYMIKNSKGVFPGKFRIEIKGWRDSDRTYEDSVTGEVFAEPEQFLPPKFNEKSELTVEINDKDEAYDFDLKLE